MYPYALFFGVGFYEIFLTIGILSAFLLADRLGVKRGFSLTLQKIVIVGFLSAIAFGFFGAVLFQAVYNFFASGIFEINADTGMTFYGGLIFGTVAFLLVWFLAGKRWCKEGEEKKKFPVIADIAGCVIPLAHAFGRIGCFFAGCCHGKETAKWYGVKMFTEFGLKTVVPVQLFEAVFLFALSAVLLFCFFPKQGKGKGKKGLAIAVYAIAYGVWRFFIEFARGDDRGASGVGTLSPSQLIAIVWIVFGVAWSIVYGWLKFRKIAERNKNNNSEVKTMEQMQAKKAFEEIFGEKAEDLFTAAGRINVIGEHVDYCGGKVFPAALNLRCNIYGKKRGGNTVRLAFRGIEGIVELDVNNLNGYRDLKIGNYQAGVAYFLQEKGVEIVGCDLYYDCTVPFGSGLSSSAAIEVATAVAFCEYAGVAYDKVELALLSQKAENQYAGVNCGIMDQFASAMGKKNCAVLLDCSTLAYEYVPLELGEYCLVVANCNKPHNLVESKYNERRQETEEALLKIQTVKKVSCLAEVTPADFEEVKGLLSPVVAKRTEHVVKECARVHEAVEALKCGNLVRLGELLNESHYSLSQLYEVTGKELDTLSGLARAQEGCLGSRMIGAGFGGCTISIVKKENAEAFIENVGKAYEKEIGYKASFYETSIEDGITVSKL